MAILQVRDVDDGLYSILKSIARREHRSLSHEVISILKSFVQKPETSAHEATNEFINLCGAWKDKKTADQLIKELRDARKNSSRFGGDNAVFD